MYGTPQDTPPPTDAATSSLHRSKLALAALRAALEDMRSRLARADADLCERALERLQELHGALDELEPGGLADAISEPPSQACELGELCQAARESLDPSLHPRILVAIEQGTQPVRIDGAGAVRCLRRLMRAMLACGADAVLLHAHVEEEQAVFAILDDQHIFDPSHSEAAGDYESARREIDALGGTLTPIGNAQEQQGLIVRLPARAALEHSSGPAQVMHGSPTEVQA